MVAVQSEVLDVGGVQIKAEAVKIVRDGYSRVNRKLEDARHRHTAREMTRLADIVRSTGPAVMPPLLTDEERRRFEELTGAYLCDQLVHLVWIILENDLQDRTMAPAAMPVRNAEHPGTEVRLVPWW